MLKRQKYLYVLEEHLDGLSLANLKRGFSVQRTRFLRTYKKGEQRILVVVGLVSERIGMVKIEGITENRGGIELKVKLVELATLGEYKGER